MMRVLASQRVVTGPYGDGRDALEHTYVTYFESLGIQLQPVPNAAASPTAYFDAEIAGVLLTGGNDVHPATYGSAVAVTGDASLARDRVERALVEEAMARRLPVLGICRGMQFLNAMFGGGLTNLEQHPAWPAHAPGATHPLEISDLRCSRWLGTDGFSVNSFHRQAVTRERLASALRAFATVPGSDLVEGVFHPAHPIAAVQYHPERPCPDDTAQRLVEAFRRGELFWERRP